MAYSVSPLEPLETRKVIHVSQISDNFNPEGDFSLLQGEKNSFMFEKDGGYGTIYRPFERRIEEPLDKLVAFAKEICGSVNLSCFPSSVLDKY